VSIGKEENIIMDSEANKRGEHINYFFCSINFTFNYAHSSHILIFFYFFEVLTTSVYEFHYHMLDVQFIISNVSAENLLRM